jgi:hypothetical protein
MRELLRGLTRRVDRIERANRDRPEPGARKIPLSVVDLIVRSADQPEVQLTDAERSHLEDYEPELAALDIGESR